LIFGKIITIVATRGQILRLKCTKFYFGWGSRQTPLGSLQRSPDSLAGFKWPTCKGRVRRGGRERERRGRKGKGGERREREGSKYSSSTYF